MLYTETDAIKAEIITWREIEGLSWEQIEKEIQKDFSMFELSMDTLKKMFADRWGSGVWIEDK